MLPALTEQEESREAVNTAPVLPIEGSLVAAVRNLEAVRAQSEQALFLLQWAPRNSVELFNSLSALQANVTNAANSYATYQEILNCKGQA
jgi:hypothetical protein